jgi:hypothetical protein
MEQKSTFSPALQFGLLTGLVLIVFTLVLFLAGVGEKSPIRFISLILYIGMLYWGMVNIRDRQLDGVMSYGKAFGTGFWIALFTAILVGIFTFFYFKYIDAGALARHLTEAENKILARNPNISDADLNKAMGFAKAFSSPIMSAIMALIWDVIIGTVLSLLIAIFAKREDKTIA